MQLIQTVVADIATKIERCHDEVTTIHIERRNLHKKAIGGEPRGKKITVMAAGI